MKREIIIHEIKEVIKKFGSFNIDDVEFCSSIEISVVGHKKEMADVVDIDGVYTKHFINDEQIDDDDFVPFELLSDDLLADVLMVCECYKTDSEKTYKRCQS